MLVFLVLVRRVLFCFGFFQEMEEEKEEVATPVVVVERGLEIWGLAQLATGEAIGVLKERV